MASYDEEDQLKPLLQIHGRDGQQVQTPRASRIAVVCILFCELCERLTYYSIIANLLIFLQNHLGFDSNSALTGTLVFSGTVYFTPMFGGWLADSVIGRYNTLYLSGLIYAVGCALLPTVAFDYEQLGVQLDQTAARAFYITGLVLIACGTGGIKSNVSTFGAFQEVSFFAGYLIPAVSILLAISLLLLPRPCMTHEAKPSGSPLGQLFKVMGNAISSQSNSIYSLPSWLDYAQISNGGRYPEDLVRGTKQVLILIPLMLPFIGFWCIYNQMQSTYLLQAERMDLSIGTFRLPAASLSLFNSLAIILVTPLLDLVIFPLIRRFAAVTKISLLKRIGLGFALAIVSVVIAGFLEIQRKSELNRSGGFEQKLTGMELVYNNCPDQLKSVTMGVYLAMNGLGSYLGSLLVAIVGAATTADPWLPEDINTGHLEYFCFLLAGVATAFLLLFLPLSRWYDRAYQRTLMRDSDVATATYTQYGSNDENLRSSGSVTLVTGDFRKA
uniref:MFS domain-containing protein n=1 Tax=Macrostomum lignano TaxID=282301 RepID=A0A1I8JBJ3_9PLAT